MFTGVVLIKAFNMDTEKKLGVPLKEMETSQPEEPCHVIKQSNDVNPDNHNGKNNADMMIEKVENKVDLVEQNYFNCFKISVNKQLIPLRIALFLWYGAGKIPIGYLTVFMKQKGLSLVEFSSIFSVAFVFQFLAAFISGIIADKIGNAKPILMFHLMITILCILALLFTPKVDSVSMSSTDIKNHSQESLMNLRKCMSYPLLDDSSNKTWKSENFTERILRVITEKCNDFNSTTFLSPNNISLEFEDPILDISKFAEDYSNVSHLPCEINLSEICLASNYEKFEHGHPIHNRHAVVGYIILVVVFLSCWSSVYRFMDVIVMSFYKTHNVSFGRERFFSMSGNVIITFLAGIVLDQFTPKGGENNYRSVYGFAACMLCLNLVAVCCIKAQLKPPSRHIWKEGLRFIRNREVIVFIIVIFLLGTSFGFIDNFCLWFLEYLKGPAIVLGLYRAVNGFYGLPIFLTSNWWLKLFSPRKLFFMAFVGYIIYGLGFSFLYNPWLSLILEATSILTYHFLWIAVVVHCQNIAPESLASTIISIAGGIHYSVGRSAGTLSFGLAIDALGPRVVFRIFAGVNTLSAILYILYLCTQRSKVEQN